jgi:hypothetical protein
MDMGSNPGFLDIDTPHYTWTGRTFFAGGMAAHLLAIILNGKPPGSFQFDPILLAPTDYNNIKAAPRK